MPTEGDIIYQRQEALELSNPTVYIIGCGGVGVWVSLALTLAGVDNITLFDGDKLSLNNLNRLPYPESWVGESKSLALARYLKSLRPQAEIIARGEFDPSMCEYGYPQYIVCCTDSLASRQMSYKWAKDVVGCFYLEIGADGERWTLSPAPPEFSTANEANRGYSSVPVHVGPCMMAGAAAAYYVLHHTTATHTHSGEWFKLPSEEVFPDHRLRLRDVDESVPTVPDAVYATGEPEDTYDGEDFDREQGDIPGEEEEVADGQEEQG